METVLLTSITVIGHLIEIQSRLVVVQFQVPRGRCVGDNTQADEQDDDGKPGAHVHVHYTFPHLPKDESLWSYPKCERYLTCVVEENAWSLRRSGENLQQSSRTL